MPLPYISPREAAKRLAEKTLTAVDIREVEEYKTLRLSGAQLQPLSVLKHLPADSHPEQAVVYFCFSGRRTKGAEDLLAARGHKEAYIMEGGLTAWMEAGLPVDKTPASMPIMRQVQIGAGALVLIFLLLGRYVAPGFTLGAALVGAGLIFAGVSGFCGLARLLALMPWNREHP